MKTTHFPNLTVEQRKARIRATRNDRTYHDLKGKMDPHAGPRNLFLIILACAAFFCIGSAIILFTLP